MYAFLSVAQLDYSVRYFVCIVRYLSVMNDCWANFGVHFLRDNRVYVSSIVREGVLECIETLKWKEREQFFQYLQDQNFQIDCGNGAVDYTMDSCKFI